MIWISILACMALAFVFSGIEAGVLTLKRARLRHSANSGVRGAAELEALLSHPERLVVTVALITNLARIIGLALLFGVLAEAIGAVAAAGVLALCLPLFALLFELLPKSLFRAFPYGILIVFGRILSAANFLLWPVSTLVEWLAHPILRVSREKAGHRLAGMDEIRHATNEAVRNETLSPLQRHFIHSVLNARDTPVRELVIPLRQVLGVPPETSIAEVLDLARERDISRIPVVEPDGSISGLLPVFDLLIDGIERGSARSYARRIVTIPGNEPLAAALVKMRAARVSVAAVIEPDANKPLGIVTGEDIVAKMLMG